MPKAFLLFVKNSAIILAFIILLFFVKLTKSGKDGKPPVFSKKAISQFVKSNVSIFPNEFPSQNPNPSINKKKENIYYEIGENNSNLFPCFSSPVKPCIETCNCLHQKPVSIQKPVFSQKTNIDCIRKNNLYAYIGIRHSEGKGIGFNQGYSTLESLFINPFYDGHIAALLNVRLHCFNNKTSAANTGLGFRYLSQDCNNAFGINVFYDSRKIHKHPIFNQLSVGIEWLGPVDLTLNGYFPIQHKKDYNGYSQKDYDGGYVITKKKYKEAFTSIVFNAGSFITEQKCFSLYGSVGQYYLELNKCNRGYGGQAKLKFEFWQCIDLELQATYDTYFQTNGRFIIGFHFDLGKNKKCEKQSPLFRYCHRNEIIPIGDSYEYDWNW